MKSRWPRAATGIVLAATTLMTGCSSLHVMSHVPIATMSRLAALRVADIDPVELRIGARLPAVLEPRPLGVKVAIEIAGAHGGHPRSEHFVLEAVNAPGELERVSRWRRNGDHLWVYRLSPTDAVRLKQLLQVVGGPDDRKNVTISAGVDACHRGPLGTNALPSTTLLRTDASDYFVLVEDLDIRSIVSAADLATQLPPCAT